MNELTQIALPVEEIRAYCEQQPIKRLSLFGSALRNELEPDSDIDLLVEYLPEASIGYFAMAQHLIDLSEILGREVDLCTPNSLSHYIRQDIIESARPIYAQAPRE